MSEYNENTDIYGHKCGVGRCMCAYTCIYMVWYICSSGHVWIKLCNVCAHCIQFGARNNQLCRIIDSLIVGAMQTDHYITSDKRTACTPCMWFGHCKCISAVVLLISILCYPSLLCRHYQMTIEYLSTLAIPLISNIIFASINSIGLYRKQLLFYAQQRQFYDCNKL